MSKRIHDRRGSLAEIEAEFAAALEDEDAQRRPARRRHSEYKTRQLCHQVQRALNLALGTSQRSYARLARSSRGTSGLYGQLELPRHRKRMSGRSVLKCTRAGRLLSRTDARKSITDDHLRRQMRGVWYDFRLSDRLRDEAPSAYKDIDAVARAQCELVKVVRVLRPVLNYKGV